MKTYTNYTLTLCLALLPLAISFANDHGATNSISSTSTPSSQYQQEAQSRVKVFATQLKGQLQQAIKTGGLISAIDVCKVQAPLIAKSLSTDGWQVARTSLKVRNQNNLADAWEEQVLAEFTDKKTRGQSYKQLKEEQLTSDNYRFMQAIPTAEVCLACHGKHIDKNVQQHINKQYPKDQAKGFSKGDIRGAFTLSKTL